MFHLKILEFRHRKIVHYILLASIIAMQVLLVVILYNETVNESNLEVLEKEIKYSAGAKSISELASEDFSSAQKDLKRYVTLNDNHYLKQYYFDLRMMRYHMDSLSKYSKSNGQFLHRLKAQDSYKTTILNLNKKIDSLSKVNLMPDQQFSKDILKLKRFEYKDVLKSIKVDSGLKVDTLGKKKLFARISAAIQDRMDVRKERQNLILTMKYGKDVSSGNFEDQIAKIFEKNNEYYQKEFSKFKKEISALKINNLKFIAEYELLLVDTGLLLDEYNRAIDLLEDKAKLNFNKQYETNKSIRNYSLIGLVVLMIVVSVILIFFTRLAFEYEERLETAQNKIKKNLDFKNRIVGMISHEVRGPLNIISIYCNLISKQFKDENLKDSLKSIQFTANSLTLLANQILKFSKDEEKKLKLDKASFKLEEELVQILKGLTGLVENSDNTFKLKMDIDSDINVYSDAIKIHELFYNIVGNANKFTNNGNINVFVKCREISTDKYILEAEIKDDGSGMSEEDLKNIFEAYYQGVISSNVQNLGMGLGLNLCKELVELFEGDIKVESELNKGTLVSFNILLERFKK